MPTLFVLGGANGAGKTTWHSAGIVNNFINEGLPFVNVDNIVLLELGGYTAENISRAEQLSRERMAILISERKDFMIESNLSKSSDYEWITLMRKNGYDTSLFFLGTDDVEINKGRVRARVIEGGHNIDDSIIEHRYSMGLSYLKSQVLNFSSAILFDVSVDGQRMAELLNGVIIFKDTECPKWVQDSLQIAERLQQKLQLKEDKNIKVVPKADNNQVPDTLDKKSLNISRNKEQGL